MPSAPLKPCPKPGCSALTKGCYCPEHKPVAWAKKFSAAPRLNGRHLQNARNRLFDNQPLCVDCLQHGRDTPATIRDHIIPLNEGGEDTPDNTQGLCVECHDKKSKLEWARARKRVGV